jgi:hypothetical protein
MGQFETQGSVTEPLSLFTCPTKFVSVLRILGIYTMDELNRTDWDKLGKYRARKGPDYVEKYYIFANSSPEAHKIKPTRCGARNCCRGYYFDPVTFDATVTSTGALFPVPESPDSEKDNAEGLDEVLFVDSATGLT